MFPTRRPPAARFVPVLLSALTAFLISSPRTARADWGMIFSSEYTSPNPPSVSPKPLSVPQAPGITRPPLPKPTKPAAGIEETDSPPGQTPKGIPDDRRIAKSDSDRIVDAILGNKLAQANSLRSEATGRPVVDYGYLNGVFTEYTFYPDGSFKWEPAKKGPSRPTYTQPANAWAAQGVPSYQPFRVHSSGLPYNESHTCPQCGLTSPDGEGTWIVQNELPNGRHTHTCPRCSASWYH